MKKRKKENKLGVWILIGIIVLAAILILGIPLALLFDGERIIKNDVAVIPIKGMITVEGGGQWGEDSASAKQIVSFIEDANSRDEIKVIILDINSPGGGAVASDQIGMAIKKTEKPVIAVISEVGASGGYWIASTADLIIANRMSITGSIGVISSYLEFSGLMEEYGVSYERLVAGELKDMGTPLKKLSEKEKRLLQDKLDKIHTFFIKEISENRKMSFEEVKKLATGEFFLGDEAHELGLVDVLGDMNVAIDYIEKELGVENPGLVEYAPERGLLDLLQGIVSDYFFNVGQGIGTTLTKQKSGLLLI
ncbi:signal peptide peptidase SppA [Candidatus Woesearchaeota archaeon]|jgi:protease IV|nr:signal peptide peptidase SppA [Candidatus Woesearchaeota archaeon]